MHLIYTSNFYSCRLFLYVICNFIQKKDKNISKTNIQKNRKKVNTKTYEFYKTCIQFLSVFSDKMVISESNLYSKKIKSRLK